ncbi:MAG: hypothetical protein KH425_06040, partial [Prevotella bivia]|nr:hypothetical protein [Prevotella bivia]
IIVAKSVTTTRVNFFISFLLYLQVLMSRGKATLNPIAYDKDKAQYEIMKPYCEIIKRTKLLI